MIAIKNASQKIVIPFCPFNKDYFSSWYVVIIPQSLLDTAKKKKKPRRYPYNVPTKIIPFLEIKKILQIFVRRF